MKRYIRSSEGRLQKIYYRLEKPSLHQYRFSGKLDEDAGLFFGDVQKVAAYDDADYWWARINGGGLIELIHDGRVQDTIEFKDFDEDAYETVGEYMDEMIERAAEALKVKNASIKPRMMYN